MKRTVDLARRFAEEKRALFRLECHSLYLPKYDLLCHELDDLGLIYFRPYVLLRTFEEQAKLYAKGRTLDGPRVTNATPGRSAHNYGCGSDWANFAPGLRGNQPWEQADWKSYAQAVETCGLEWGGNFSSLTDLDHNELKISVSWSIIGAVHSRSPEEADNLIHSKLII